MNKLIILRGYSGSGKSTIGRLLETQKLAKFIDHNKILNFIASITDDDDGVYEEIAQLELALTNKLLADYDVVVGRGFSSPSSIEPYLKVAQYNQARAYILRLDAPFSLLEARVQAPERKLGYNPTTTPKALRDWAENHPMQDIEGEIVIDASKPIHQIADDITAILNNSA
jgi:shikimate kinase